MRIRNDLMQMLTASGLHYEDEGDGVFALPYDNDTSVYVHKFEDFLRGYVSLGTLPGDDLGAQGEAALDALRQNFSDPAGRLSIFLDQSGEYNLYWEFQVPFSAATPAVVHFMGQTGAQQAAYWRARLADPNAAEPEGVELPGDEDELFELLGELLEQTGLIYTLDEENERYVLPYENGEELNVSTCIYRGTVWTYTYLGGMPGDNRAEQGQIAIELLRRNWDDSFGRLSLDSDFDLLWESQMPADFLTSDFLAILASTCSHQASSFWEEYGHKPFNG